MFHEKEKEEPPAAAVVVAVEIHFQDVFRVRTLDVYSLGRRAGSSEQKPRMPS